MKTQQLRQRIRRTALCVALGMCFAGAAWADTGGLRITVNGSNGEPLAGATVKVSSPDSLGVYLTRAPKVGRSDAERNCLSNVRAEGLVHAEAARKLWWLAEAARRLGATGVALKDDSGLAPGAVFGGRVR